MQTPPGASPPEPQSPSADQAARPGYRLREDRRREEGFRYEDARWSRSHQIRDWLWLGVMIVAYCAWTLFVYFLEPGLR